MRNYNNKVDFHSHYLPPSYYEYLKRYEDERPDNYDTPDWSEEKHISLMDKLGVAYSLISISSPNLSRADDNIEKDYVRRINNEGAAFVAKYPNRLGLIAELPLPNVENAFEEAEYALNVLQAEGFGLATNYRGKYLGCPEFDPLMEFINERKSVIIIHPMKPYGHYEEVNEDLPIPAFEFFVETTRTFINLVLKDIFNRYMNIKWVFPHAGAFISLLSDRFDSFSAVMKLKDPLFTADYFGAMKHVYFDLAGFPLPKQLQILKQNVPIDNMVYGGDGPYTPDLATIALAGAIEQTDQLTEQEKEKIFTLNAIDIIPGLSEKNRCPREKRRFKRSNLLIRKLISTIYINMNKKNHR